MQTRVTQRLSRRTAVLLCLAGATGCGTTAQEQSAPISRPAGGPGQPAPASPRDGGDTELTARLMRYSDHVKFGRRVSPGALGERIFIDGEHGFALAALIGGIYPAATVDGGHVWRVNGPRFVRDAMNPNAIVTHVGAASPRTYFAYGGGGSAVDVTNDAGKHWWQTYLGDVVLAVVAQPRHLTGIAQDDSGGRVRTLVYVSPDRGRHWWHTSRSGA